MGREKQALVPPKLEVFLFTSFTSTDQNWGNMFQKQRAIWGDFWSKHLTGSLTGALAGLDLEK